MTIVMENVGTGKNNPTSIYTRDVKQKSLLNGMRKQTETLQD